MSKLQELTRQLVDHLAPSLNSDQRVYAAEYVQKEVSSDTKGSTRREWVDVLGILRSAEKAARIRVQDHLADGLERCVGRLLSMRGHSPAWEDDLPIQISNLPQHVQLLINLSNQPTSQTHEFAYKYLHRDTVPRGPSEEQKLYDEIMAEPFTGEHWVKGYDEEVKHGWTDSEGDSDSDNDSFSSGSGEYDRIVTPSSTQRRVVERKEAERLLREERVKEGEKRLELAKETLEGLEKAYWNAGGEELKEVPDGVFGWRALVNDVNPASLALSLGTDKTLVKVITALQFQREILFALMGRPGVIFDFDNDGCQVKADHPAVRFYSSSALQSTLKATCHRAEQLSYIKAFTEDQSKSPSSSTPRPAFRTRQAFAEACRAYVGRVEYWISNVEIAYLRGVEAGTSIPSTPLSLLREVETKFGTQLDDLTSLIPLSTDPTVLLNSIYSIYTTSSDPSHREDVLDLFLQTVRPVWSVLGDWLIDGMPIPQSLNIEADETIIDLDDEISDIDPDFCIQRDKDVSWADEDFWEAGYIVTEQGSPTWMGNTRDMVLEAGKARGLLKGLAGDVEASNEWKDLRRLLAGNTQVMSENTIDIGRAVNDIIAPLCQITTFQLRRVLEEECGLIQHLEAIEGIMYLKGHHSVDVWLNHLEAQFQEGRRWNDMASLTSGFRDAIEETHEDWLNPSAIRLSPTKDSPKGNPRDPKDILKALKCVRVGYNAPFPLTVLFTPTSLGYRSQVFGMLLQLDYALRYLKRQPTAEFDTEQCVSRQRVLWVLQTIWTWITDRVISTQIELYHERLSKLSSLQEMISLELEHTRSIREYAFQHDHTADLYDHLIAIMEIAVKISPHPEDDVIELGGEARTSTTAGDTSGEQGISLEQELDFRVREIQLSVEKLAFEGEHNEQAAEKREVWTMLSFALDDWK